jgi:hypothetical protein
LSFEEEGFSVVDVGEAFFCEVAEAIVDKEVSKLSTAVREEVGGTLVPSWRPHRCFRFD